MYPVHPGGVCSTGMSWCIAVNKKNRYPESDKNRMIIVDVNGFK